IVSLCGMTGQNLHAVSFFECGSIGKGVVPDPAVSLRFTLSKGGGIVLLGGRNAKSLLVVGAPAIVVIEPIRASEFQIFL
ncbi:MAG: hypothetical protein RLZZ47_1497, partial [Bacteroidota bacterium]